jgi:hypothetical protein
MLLGLSKHLGAQHHLHLGYIWGVLSVGCHLDGRPQGKEIACESLFDVNCSQISPETAGRKALENPGAGKSIRIVVDDTEPYTPEERSSWSSNFPSMSWLTT